MSALEVSQFFLRNSTIQIDVYLLVHLLTICVIQDSFVFFSVDMFLECVAT